MSTSVSKTVFHSEIDAWDEGPHTLYCVYSGVSDYYKFFIKTNKSGRFVPLFGGDDALIAAIIRASGRGEEVTGDERVEVISRANDRKGTSGASGPKDGTPEERGGESSIRGAYPQQVVEDLIRAGNAMYDELESYFSPDSGTPNLKRAFDLLAAWDAATAKAHPEK